MADTAESAGKKPCRTQLQEGEEITALQPAAICRGSTEANTAGNAGRKEPTKDAARKTPPWENRRNLAAERFERVYLIVQFLVGANKPQHL